MLEEAFATITSEYSNMRVLKDNIRTNSKAHESENNIHDQ